MILTSVDSPAPLSLVSPRTSPENANLDTVLRAYGAELLADAFQLQDRSSGRVRGSHEPLKKWPHRLVAGSPY